MDKKVLARTSRAGQRTTYTDATTNDSDKTLTGPNGKILNIHSVFVHFTCTATVGSRQVRAFLTDGTNGFWASLPLTLTASQQGVMLLVPQGPVSASVRSTPAGATPNASVTDVLPAEAFLMPSWTLRIMDTSGVDAAADDMTYTVLYTEEAGA